MKTKQKLVSLALAIIFILAFAACGAASKTATDEMTTENSSIAAAPEEAGSYALADTAGTKDAGTGTSVGTAVMPSSEKIIYSGSATVETMEFDKTLGDLNKMVTDCGGFIETSSVTGNDFYSQHNGYASYRSAQYTFRIPVDKFKSFTESLDTLGNVPYSSSNAENITMQYTDTESRLTAYRTKETRLLELLAKANSMEDILAIESSLTDVQYQIESLTSQIKSWDSLISYSTLSITVNEVSLYTEDSTSTLSYGQQLKETFTRSIAGVGRFFKGFFKFLVGAFPVLVVLAIIAVPVFLIVTAAHRKRTANSPAPTNFNNNNDANNRPPFQQ